MDIDLVGNVKEFNKEHENECSRGKSFDGIHNAFIAAIESGNPDYENLALHLYAFLGSWGMLHYRAFLMQRNYKILKGVVEKLFERSKKPEFRELINFDPKERHRATYKANILALRQDIINTLIDDYRKTDNDKADDKSVNVTDTLVGKILLGTYACMPAFDTNFRKTATEVFQMKSITIENCIEKVLEYALENKSMLKEQNGYPVMKVLDMAFWERGKNL